MVEVTWTEAALADMKALVLFISRDSRQYAQVFCEKIFSVSDDLCEFPERGRVVPELNNHEIRELILSHYRMIYRFRPRLQRIEIIAVIHGSMVRDLSFLIDK